MSDNATYQARPHAELIAEILDCRVAKTEREYAAAREIERLERRLHEVREIYAGMDGFIPQTAPESYCLRVIRQMYDAAMWEKQ